ncbi:151_t:CDS:2 [Funneliformis geosporum]|nr:151_t:CDS:2 [Funneliformis geosporum]
MTITKKSDFGISQPNQSNRTLEFSTDSEINYNLQAGTSSSPDNKWKQWLYQYIDNKLDKNSNNKKDFVPKLISGTYIQEPESLAQSKHKIVFIGPLGSTMRSLGDKISSMIVAQSANFLR